MRFPPGEPVLRFRVWIFGKLVFVDAEQLFPEGREMCT